MPTSDRGDIQAYDHGTPKNPLDGFDGCHGVRNAMVLVSDVGSHAVVRATFLGPGFHFLAPGKPSGAWLYGLREPMVQRTHPPSVWRSPLRGVRGAAPREPPDNRGIQNGGSEPQKGRECRSRHERVTQPSVCYRLSQNSHSPHLRALGFELLRFRPTLLAIREPRICHIRGHIHTGVVRLLSATRSRKPPSSDPHGGCSAR